MLRGLPGLSLLSQTCEAQPAEIAQFLFGRALILGAPMNRTALSRTATSLRIAALFESAVQDDPLPSRPAGACSNGVRRGADSHQVQRQTQARRIERRYRQ